MKIIVGAIIGASLSALSMLAHEADIFIACTKYGHSGKAMWISKIKCSPINDENSFDKDQ